MYRQGSDMLESGFVKAGGSPGAVDGGKPAEGRRRYSWSRCHCLFFILVVGAVLFFYRTDIWDMAPDWNAEWLQQYKPSKLWSPFEGQRSDAVAASNATESGAPGSAAAASSTEAVKNITTAKVLSRTTNASVVPQEQKEPPPPPPPPPYVSPGPYLVEYPYEYRFVINQPSACEQQKPFLVLMVPVAPHNRQHRDAIRSTWGGQSAVQGRAVRLFFLLGLQAGDGAPRLQERLLQESEEHRDLLQSDFLDCYKNLTIKTMVMLQWLHSHCPGASYAMKVDSDTFLNVPNLLRMLSDAPKVDYMTGLVARGAAVLRDPKSKWFLPVELHPRSVYPPYALGLGYVLSMDLPEKLLEASRHLKPVYIEDVFLGLCMQHLGIPPTNPPNGGYFHVFPLPYSRCAYSKLVVTVISAQTDRVAIWKDFNRPGPPC